MERNCSKCKRQFIPRFTGDSSFYTNRQFILCWDCFFKHEQQIKKSLYFYNKWNNEFIKSRGIREK